MKNKLKTKRGFTMIEIMIAIGIVITLAALSIHGLVRARMVANEAAALKNIKVLCAAFESYK